MGKAYFPTRLNSGDAVVASGGGEAVIGGTLDVSATSAQTGANTDETTLYTYELRANTLSRDGQAVRVKAWGTTAANGNNKTFRLYFGATVLRGQLVALNNGTWVFDAVVVRTASGAQEAEVELRSSTTTTNVGYTAERTTPAADTTAAIVIKTTGINGTANAGDIVFRGAIVELLN